MKKPAHKFLLFVLLSSAVLYGQTFPVKIIMENGPRDKRINIVFLGDGYQTAEMQKFQNDVKSTVDKLFLESPYKEYKSLFNIYAIETPSKESGTDHPGTASDCGSLKDSVFYKDTYYNSTFDAGNIHRLLISANYSQMMQVLQNNLPEYDIILMVVNHDWYGGSGGSIAVFSANGVSSEVAIHETGHSFATLADEYEYGATEPIRYDWINVTFRTNRDSIPWKSWISPSTPVPTPVSGEYESLIGLFEGAYYRQKGMYRPKINCKMRILGVPFCEVCVEQHVKSIFNRIDLIDKHNPAVSTMQLLTNEKKAFGIEPTQLQLNNLTTEWYLDDKLIASATNSILLDASLYTVGLHKLKAVVKHTSPLVKSDPFNYLQKSVSWIVEIKETTGIEHDELPSRFSLEQNYPNPFNPLTTIIYNLPESGHVLMKVYDLLGREVVETVNEIKNAGKHSVRFNGSNLSSGLYIYTIKINNYFASKVMFLTK
jgi:hypothetical protein